MWNDKRYNEVRRNIETGLDSGMKKPFDYMMLYKQMIENDDFEAAKAITDVLAPLNYITSDTHQHIQKLNN